MKGETGGSCCVRSTRRVVGRGGRGRIGDGGEGADENGEREGDGVERGWWAGGGIGVIAGLWWCHWGLLALFWLSSSVEQP